MFNERPTLSGIRYAKANVNGVNGIILLPNAWEASTYELNYPNGGNYDSNTITIVEWLNYLEANGAVFLSAAGQRNGTSISNGGSDGYYWSSTCGSYAGNLAEHLHFYDGQGHEYFTYWGGYRNYGFSVRLVQDY